MNKPKVFVLKEQVRRGELDSRVMDFSPAMSYGDLEFVTRDDMPLHPNSMLKDVWQKNVAHFVAEYDSSRDFVIATGRPDSIFTIGYALGLAGKTPRFLVWRSQENRYRVLDLQS